MILTIVNQSRIQEIIPGPARLRIEGGATKDVNLNCVDIPGLKAHKFLTYTEKPPEKSIGISYATSVESAPKATKAGKRSSRRTKLANDGVKNDGTS